jgi:hypothetical protein
MLDISVDILWDDISGRLNQATIVPRNTADSVIPLF